MPNDNAASTPDVGTAGDAFAAAFDAASKTVDLSGAEFAKSAMEPSEPETTPVETEETEPATPVKPAGKGRAKVEDAPVAEAAREPTEGPQAPANWDTARREAFGKLPPDARKIVLDIAKGVQGEATRVTTEAAEDRRFSHSVKSLISEDHRSQMRRAGLTDEQGIAHLVSLNDLYTRDPAGYVRMVVERSGLDPRQVFQLATGDGSVPQGQQPTGGADPYQQLYGYLQNVHGELEGIKREREQATLRTVNRSIERFAQEKDAESNPAHPYFDQVQGVMVQLLATPKYLAIEDYGERLNAAYNDAVYLDPNIKSQIVDGEVQKRLKEERQKADVAKARRAQAPVKAAPTTSGKPKTNTLEDALRNSMNMVGVS